MFTRLRSLGLRLAVGLVALTMASLGAVVISAGSSNATEILPLDHYTCYSVSTITSTAVPGFGIPPAVELFNQFAPNGMFMAVSGVTMHCNPTAKTVKTATGKVTTPITAGTLQDHLLCFTTPQGPAGAVVTQPTYKVLVSDQFTPKGPVELDTGQPTELCLPTWKTVATAANPGPPTPMTQAQPPGVDHFECYSVAVDPNSSNQFVLPPVTLQDQFWKVKATLLTPSLLCLPTLKELSPTQPGTTAENFNDPHLVCFTLSVATAFPGFTVYDQNQFGLGQLDVKALKYLCVPSTKTVASPPGQIVITKVDPAGTPLVGATFTAASTSSPTTVAGTCTTNFSGTCTIANLAAPGSYVVNEMSPPAGYLPAASQTVTIPSAPGSVGAVFIDTPITTGG